MTDDEVDSKKNRSKSQSHSQSQSNSYHNHSLNVPRRLNGNVHQSTIGKLGKGTFIENS